MKNDNPARKKFEPMLSPFVDGELSPSERQQVEQHLAANKESAMQVADFRAASGLMRLTFDQQADQEDWKDFSAGVLAKLTPEKAPFFERMKLTVSEMFTYQRTMFVTSLATAALVALVAVPVAMKLASSPLGYAQAKVEVQTVKVDQGATVEPVVMTTEKGDAIIWMVDQNAPAQSEKKVDEKLKTQKKSDDVKSEETGGDSEPKKAGDL
jgi:anti-sigma factor RsiW